MKRFLILIFCLHIAITGNSIEFSDNLISSVLTVSPGNELYSTFGHTAIRIKDLQNGNDYVFNYGTFNFNTPNFYIKFALGQLDYLLSIESFDNFMESCKFEDRSVKEQILNFNKFQNLKLLKLLIENYKPENRYYRYKFFTDNCSTRVRDIIVLASGDTTLLIMPEVEMNNSFRSLMNRYLKTMPWSRFGIELLLGTLTDKPAGYNSLFIPDNLKKSIGLARIADNSLVKEERDLFEYKIQNSKGNLFSPLFIMILILFTTIFIQLKKSWIHLYDRILFFLLGFLGLFICTLGIFSEHAELHYNLVIVFLLPTNIILPFLKQSPFRKYYCLIALIIAIMGLVLLPLLPQKFNFTFVVLTLALGIRYYFNIKKQNETKF
jgi:hypothetical protein